MSNSGGGGGRVGDLPLPLRIHADPSDPRGQAAAREMVRSAAEVARLAPPPALPDPVPAAPPMGPPVPAAERPHHLTPELQDAARRRVMGLGAELPPPVRPGGDAGTQLDAIWAYLANMQAHVVALESRLVRQDFELRQWTIQGEKRLQKQHQTLREGVEQFRGQARFIANLGYVFAMMAQDYRETYKEVAEVVEGKASYEVALYGARKVLVAAFTAALAGVSAGIAAGVTLAVFGDLVDKFAESYEKSFGNYHEPSDAAKKAADDSVKKPIEKMTEHIVDWMGEGVIRHTVGEGGERHIGGNIDPYDFFLKTQVQLHQLAALVHGGGVPDLKARAQKVMTTLSKDYEFLTGELKSADDPRLAHLKEDIKISMRRLVWRLHCRSQWENSISKYLVKGKNDVWTKTVRDGIPSLQTEKPATIAALDKPEVKDNAEKWPREVWDSVKAWPPFFREHIAGAFRGREGEHKPDHPLANHYPWFSMAVVHCCQVERPDGKKIDLLRNRHFGVAKEVSLRGTDAGGEGVDPRTKDVVRIVSDHQLVFSADAGVIKVVDNIESTGGVFVRIRSVHRGTHGYKGKVESAHERLNVAQGDQITVTLQAAPWMKSRGIARAYIQILKMDATGKLELSAPHTVVEKSSASSNFATSDEQTATFDMSTVGLYAARVVGVSDQTTDEPKGLIAETTTSSRTLFDTTLWKIEVRAR